MANAGVPGQRDSPELDGAMGGAHRLPAVEVVRALASDETRGLAHAEAERRLARDGPNALPEPGAPSVLSLVGRQLNDSLVLLLIAAAAVSLALGEILDGAVIGAIVVINAGLGAVQEGRAETAARAVRALLSPTAIVVRDGIPSEIEAPRLVRGDLVHVSAGDRVPADGRLLQASRLEVDESAMTGESLPAAKDAGPPVSEGAPLAERPNMLFAGTTVTRGTARVVLTATGPGTELARIAGAAGETSPTAPLQEQLDRLARILLEVAAVICLGLTALSLAHGQSLGDSLLVGISLAVAAVPEGLAAVVTITLAVGMHRLARRGAVVRRLNAVETLGSATVICTDKTGTLTTNRMTVVRLLPVGGSDEEAERGLLAAALVASGDAHDPGELAIAAEASRRGLGPDEALGGREVVGGEPFDSERKRMSVVVEDARGRRASYLKGAPEVLVPRLASAGEGARVAALAREWAGDAIRVMMVARRRDLDHLGDAELGLEPVGLIGLIDPLRESARDSVRRAREAGIRTIMLTGDHPETAIATARACGIGPSRGTPTAITGPELEGLPDAELGDRIGALDVFARVTPHHKLRIVSALQQRSEVVAVTGDGVNDVPALAAAEIGVAMGRGGSDAAMEAAEIVLTDNDFSTLVAAVEGGRRIYANVLRFVNFLLAANAGEVMLFVLVVSPGLGVPLTVAQILLVNLLTDALPAVALGFDPADEAAMRRPPRPREQGILDPIRWRLVVGGVATGLAAFAAFLIGDRQSPELARTMAFTTVVFAQLGYVYAVRGDGPFYQVAGNRLLNGAVALSALVAVLVLTVPPLQDAFSTVALGTRDLAIALALAAAPLLATELLKLLTRRRSGGRVGPRSNLNPVIGVKGR